MNIIVRNTQRAVPVDLERVRAVADRLRVLVGYPDFGLHIWITTDATVRKYNKQFRHVDKTTDILSFPYWPDLQAGKRIRAAEPEDRELGDLIISAPYVLRQAQDERLVRTATELQVAFEERLELLLVHGVCHLLGYDHIVDSDWRRMRAKEAYLRKKLKETPR